MPTYSTKSLDICAVFGRYGKTLAHPNEPSGKSRQEGDSASRISLRKQEHVKGRSLRSNYSTRIGVVADALTSRKPSVRRCRPVCIAGCCRKTFIDNRTSGPAGRACQENRWLFHCESPN
jgi:hypothetical protein